MSCKIVKNSPINLLLLLILLMMLTIKMTRQSIIMLEKLKSQKIYFISLVIQKKKERKLSPIADHCRR